MVMVGFVTDEGPVAVAESEVSERLTDEETAFTAETPSGAADAEPTLPIDEDGKGLLTDALLIGAALAARAVPREGVGSQIPGESPEMNS